METVNHIGDYQLVKLLGKGGMGAVWLARHTHLNKNYALKVLAPKIADHPAMIDRFKIEARVMADLDHPNIVKVHNFGEENGQFYLVMDYVAGPDGRTRNLAEWSAIEGRLPEATVIGVAEQICAGLQYAHNLRGDGVIHRDLKPLNLLVSDERTENGIPRIKIADFGIAKIMDEEYLESIFTVKSEQTTLYVGTETADTDSTAAASQGHQSDSTRMIGSLDYMSPEQRSGDAITPATDIYALGVILYQLLTGEKLHLHYQPPSALGASKGWDPIVKKCLALDPKDRFQDARQLSLALGELTGRARNPQLRPLAWGVVAVGLLATAAYFINSRDDRVPPEPPANPVVPADKPPTLKAIIVEPEQAVTNGPPAIVETPPMVDTPPPIISTPNDHPPPPKKPSAPPIAPAIEAMKQLLAQGKPAHHALENAPDDPYIRAWRQALVTPAFGGKLGTKMQLDAATYKVLSEHADTLAYPEALFLLALEKGDTAGLKIAADSGHIEAAHAVGTLLEREHPEDAATAYLRAAEGGYVPAMNTLGALLYRGHIPGKSTQHAVQWLKRAAEQGYRPAMHNLVIAFLQDGQQDVQFAEIQPYLESAEVDQDATLIYLYGLLHEVGKGVPNFETRAIRLYQVAATLGHFEAEEALVRLGVTQ